MVEIRAVLPVTCRKCGGVFDIWPALSNLAEMDKFEMVEEIELNLIQSFCWKCKQEMMIAIASV